MGLIFLALSFVGLLALVGRLWQEDTEISRYERYVSGQVDPTDVPQYEAKRRIKLDGMQWLLLRTGAFGLLSIFWGFILLTNIAAFWLFVLLLLLLTIYHLYVLQRYFAFWRPLQLRELTRDYPLERGVVYTTDADGELTIDDTATGPPAIRYELRGDGELVPVYPDKSGENDGAARS